MSELWDTVKSFDLTTTCGDFCDSLDDEVSISKKDLLLGGTILALAGVIIGMLLAYKNRPVVKEEKKKKHCLFGKCCK